MRRLFLGYHEDDCPPEAQPSFLVALRGGPTRSHPEHGSETPQHRRYCLGNWVGKYAAARSFQCSLSRGSISFIAQTCYTKDAFA